ncbi:hypothetical protein M427DRAFT_266467 [Gonapodya prolifera JEL478]|uniref:Uncharacterized protein n=1 Tax=Gonapodya prolifera (strain JEL478) TaxID=1344416 RepID=A0A138ZWT0_GONPJ|nr:hypothetical protein M427DRAFT_266467 [Gonapodya prolifera JEL478]|eukprot:KXS08956.1 hypothetical protein M427DRAFT_266467 [Gonapodya prolifera JEL478]
MHIAAKHGHLGAIRYPIDRGVDFPSDHGQTLTQASLSGLGINIVRYLLDSGDDIHMNIEACLVDSLANRHQEVVKLLLERGGRPEVVRQSLI